MNAAYTVPAIVLVILATVLIGALGLRISRTTSDFYVASRSVNPGLNAAAISGEYLSAASFLGIAGLILVYGPNMLWYPFGFTAGYLVLLLLVAAPLRRSGAYTLPDFAEARLESRYVHRVASVFVVGVGWLYLVPQLQGAGLTMTVITGAPRWAGGLLVAAVVTVVVAAGGMRSITFVQAFQYWLKLTALLVPAAFLLVAWQTHDGHRLAYGKQLTFRERTHVTLSSPLDLSVTRPVRVTVTGDVDGRGYAGTTLDLGPGRHHVEQGARLDFAAGTPVPDTVVMSGGRADQSVDSGPQPHSLYTTYSLIIATLLGTMGLPHVVVRYYTSPTGAAARRTTVVVLVLLGAFYLLSPVYGMLARLHAPDLILTGDSDAAVLVLPARLIRGVTGELLGSLLSAGAFAAFLATTSGLTIAVTGVLTKHVLPSRGRTSWGVRRFRWVTLLATGVPAVAQVLLGDLPVADSVGMAFALSAAAFCPLLTLGIWWRRLTPQGAAAGLVVGGGSALAAVVATIVGGMDGGWWASLLGSPALWSVPLSFLVTVIVSLATQGGVPGGTEAMMRRLHTPEDPGGRPDPAAVRGAGG
ncbi:cation acetate symporter [Actinoallomurus iriomotensis]|uniref:Cation acetate symporter n=1 Tax=Actinoallomurus iriomotensis TaxID=478107 RepID=A0A9W6VNT3_9ACTN|nr:cation acetate symporter [Actinoallomurus iriomotensis]GLY73777.1 cation acetate symporter [Actinoallomurus iriomotensis]